MAKDKVVRRAAKREPVKTEGVPGELYPADSLFMRVDAGTAKLEDGRSYELSHTMGGAMMVRSEKSGRWWALSWQEAVELAIKAGIDQEEAPSA